MSSTDLAALNSDEWYPLRIHNSHKGYVGFGLQNDSEFRELFNHHLGKERGETYILRGRHSISKADPKDIYFSHF